MPKPKSGESKDDYMKRCIPIVMQEGKDNDQAVAMCNSMFEKKEMKLESVDIDKWVEVFKAGKWKGYTFKLSDIDEAIENFNNQVAEPYITIDHNPGVTKETQDFFKTMNLGTVSALKRNGESLMAKFKNVPKLIAELINSGTLAKRSVEWWTKFKHASGKIFNNVLEGITFHGANGLPAISTLADIPKLFKDNTKSIENGDLVSIELKQEVKNMSDINISKEEYQVLLKNGVELDKLKMDIESKDELIDNLKTELKTNKDELVEMKTEKEKLLQLKADIEKKEKDSIENEANEYVDNLIQDEKLLKKFKDIKVNEYIRLKTEKNDDGLKLFKEDLESRGKVLDNSEITKDFSNKTGEITIKTEYKNEKDIAENQINDMDDIDEKIKAYMKKNKMVENQDNYMKAGLELGVFNESEIEHKENIQ